VVSLYSTQLKNHVSLGCMNRERDSRGSFCGAVRATKEDKTLIGRGGRRGGSTSIGEQKPPIEETPSNLEEKYSSYAELNHPEIPRHK
jgi:hypothetical protein